MTEPVQNQKPSRRDVLQAAAAVTGLGLVTGVGCAGSTESGATTHTAVTDDGSARSEKARIERDEDLLDEALQRVDERIPDLNFNRSNHVPMVAEALCVLGRADAIRAWVDENLEEQRPGPAPRTRVDASEWRSALARPDRFADWRAHFQAELLEDDWRTVIRRWVPRFTPGLAASATHGVIRVAHAARSLSTRDNTIRRATLANGLAYWAVSYEELPWDGSRAPERSVEAALAKVVPRRPSVEPPSGNIVSGVRALAETPGFRGVAGLVDTSDPGRMLSESASAFARLYLANPDRKIAFVHSITAPSSLRLLAPYLDEPDVRAAATYAWQAAAGLYVVYGDPRKSPVTYENARTETKASLAASAIASGGAHAIKLAEACLREHAISGDPVLLAAARDAATTLVI